ncbi:MsnO8 family LLM class oxidoreductase [Actinoplanes sp. NPDC049118]|uniref:MsnO8 family LLM class oxidoreductase n=1 Tax=Actinoplanes sp. NPDC049118 TaxID=3155769 RepID=UPI00340CA9BC
MLDGGVRLSVLESTAAQPGALAYDAIQQSIMVAKAAESAGCHRIWVTEHHAEPTIASSAPAVLVAHLAAHTTGIRVGSGGVMLVNHAPLVVAEQFATLEAAHPGRIDLGIGSAAGAPGNPPVFRQALGSLDRPASAHPQRVDELIGFVRGDFPAGHPYRDVVVSPRVHPVPIFLLGSSMRGGLLAAERGLPFAFAHHLGAAQPGPVLTRYRSEFRATAPAAEPYVIVSVAVLCADSDAEAEHLAGAVVADHRRRTEAGPGGPDRAPGSLLVGGPRTVAEGLAGLAAATGADEMMMVPIDRDGPGRIRTIRLAAAGWPRSGDGGRRSGVRVA